MTQVYYRPIAQTDPFRPNGALRLAGGWTWFALAEVLTRDGSQGLIPATDLPPEVLARLTSARPDFGGIAMDRPRIMSILNVTPDSFSDGGDFLDPAAALAQARRMVADGADILDIGGESTRPGARIVTEQDEIARTAPVIAGLRAEIRAAISIDTRKALVAKAALDAGADIVNDVAAMTYDAGIASVTAQSGAPICLMHAQGTPETMHLDPRYDNVLLEVYDFLEERVSAAIAAGIPRDRICVDPGIGFGKTLDHNLTLIRNLSLFHGLGCPVLLGASRKRFIGTLGNAPEAKDRMPGSIAVALAGAAQGVQILRVHDTKETRQALSLQMALSGES